MAVCLDGPLAGQELPTTTARWIVFSFLESCGNQWCPYRHVGQHKVHHDGRWLCSFTDLGLGDP